MLRKVDNLGLGCIYHVEYPGSVSHIVLLCSVSSAAQSLVLHLALPEEHNAKQDTMCIFL